MKNKQIPYSHYIVAMGYGGLGGTVAFLFVNNLVHPDSVVLAAFIFTFCAAVTILSVYSAWKVKFDKKKEE